MFHSVLAFVCFVYFSNTAIETSILSTQFTHSEVKFTCTLCDSHVCPSVCQSVSESCSFATFCAIHTIRIWHTVCLLMSPNSTTANMWGVCEHNTQRTLHTFVCVFMWVRRLSRGVPSVRACINVHACVAGGRAGGATNVIVNYTCLMQMSIELNIANNK